jgi:hypothetical protein
MIYQLYLPTICFLKKLGLIAIIFCLNMQLWIFWLVRDKIENKKEH